MSLPFGLLAPWRPASVIPTLPTLSLTDDERQLIAKLEQICDGRQRSKMELSRAYYLGDQVIKNLRIAVPKELEFLHTVVGWPALAVDPYVERLFVDGFRLRGATDTDQDLADLWEMNGLDAEQSLAFKEALMLGRCFWTVGSPLEPGGVPRITAESPLNTAALWNLRGDAPEAVFQRYWAEGRQHAVLLLPNQTVTLAADDNRDWQIVDRDVHDFGFVPVVRMPHNALLTSRDGSSAITTAVRSITDSTCRDLMDLEVAREIYSVPGITLLGATEADFQNTDGSAKSAWQAYVTRIRMMERDENGELSQIHQMQPYDPSVFTRLVEMRAAQMSAEIAAPPQDLGLYTQGNPVSVESVDASEIRRNRRGEMIQMSFGVPLVKMTQFAVRFMNKGELPDEFLRMTVDWRDLNQPSMSAASDAITKQIAAGSIPATSDVTLKKLGHNRAERDRLAQDRVAEQGNAVLQQLADSLAQQPEPAGGGNVG